MTFKPELLLHGAVEAGRHALRDLDPDQVPASMHRVAAYSGGSLPPPFARALLRELAGNEFLRDKTLECLDDAEATPSRLFLERGDAWSLALAEAAHDLGARAAASGDRSVELERDALAAEIASLKERLKSARKRVDGAERAARDAGRAQRAPQREAHAADQQNAARIAELEAAHGTEVERLEAQVERLDGELRTVRDALRDERRKRAGLEADRVTGATPAIPTADPDALAEHLDLLAVMAAAAGPEVSELDISGRATQPCRLAFPASLLPDSAEAIDWLCAAGRAEVLIDGYNLGFLLRDVTEPGPARAVALEVTNRLALTCPEADLVVVFDSSANLDDASTSGSGAYSVVYTGGGTADDEIVARVGECAVVVTNDRELRERAEAAGAIALWSDALAAWSRRR